MCPAVFFAAVWSSRRSGNFVKTYCRITCSATATKRKEISSFVKPVHDSNCSSMSRRMASAFAATSATLPDSAAIAFILLKCRSALALIAKRLRRSSSRSIYRSLLRLGADAHTHPGAFHSSFYPLQMPLSVPESSLPDF